MIKIYNSLAKIKLLLHAVFLCLIISGFNNSHAQTSVPNSDMWVTNNSVNAIAVDGDYTYIGGDFTIVGPNTGHGGKLTTTSSSVNLAFPKVNAAIFTSIPDGSGGWYIGGEFTEVGSFNRNYIAHINSDGTVDPTWDPNANNSVFAIALSGSDIYVGGYFATIGGQTRNSIAKLNNTNGNADATWNPNASNVVRSIALSGSDIYVGGDFLTIGGQSRNRIAKLNNTNGNADLTWNPNSSNGDVRVVAVNGSDIYAGGNFTNIGGQTRNRIAKLNNTNGSADPTWNPNADGDVFTIAFSGSDIYVGGYFTNIGGQTRNYIAKLNNTNGNADATWDPNATSGVYTVVISGSDIYAGGDFTNIGGQTRNSIAKLNNANGNADGTWNPNAGSSVWVIAISGSDIYAGGYFTTIGGQTRNHIAKINNVNGQLDETWNPNADGTVMSIAISGSDIYAGGDFTNIGGQTRNSIAKLNNTNGSADLTWNPNAGSPVKTIAVSGSDIYAGGNFTTIGGQTRNRIAKLNNTNGNADGTWNPNADNSVNTITISGSDIYAGGYFTTIGGQTRNRIAKLNNTNGNADGTWNPNADNIVNTIAVSGSDIYAGGNFNTIGGQTRHRIAKLNNTNGNADGTWNPDAGPSFFPWTSVNKISINGTDIYAGGDFNNIGGQTRNCIARLNNSDGSADLTWDPNASSGVNAIAVSGTDVYIGGYFSAIGGNSQQCFALFRDITIPSELSGDYTVGLTLFNRMTGKNITFEKSVKRVWVEVPVIEENKGKKGDVISANIFGKTKSVEVDEISWIPMENGRKYDGPLYVKKSEHPEYNYPNDAAGVYATVTAAIADLNTRGVSGPVRFLLNDASYTSETLPITIDVSSLSVPTAINTVTILPNAGVTTAISGVSTSSVFKLYGADYIIIDGSNNGSTSRNLTISNTTLSGATYVIWIESKGTGTGAAFNTIKNCNLNNAFNTSGSYGIYASGDDNDNITIQNNVITKCYEGIYVVASDAGINDNLTIVGNTIGSSTASEYVYKYGIEVAYGTGGLISQNLIQNFISETTTPAGIVIGTGFINAEISGNNINNLIYTGTGGWGGRGMYINTGNASSNLTIANNLIYTIGGDGYTDFSFSSPVGMYFDGITGGLNIYYNSVYMNGDLTYDDLTLSAAILFYESTITAVDLRDNIFQNSMNNTTNTGALNYAIYSYAPASSFTSIDYNDYYVTGAQGVLGYFGGDQLTLSGWQTATTQDANSISSDPLFAGTSDLRILVGSPALAAGTPIAGITVDYAGTIRNVTTPSIGAYENGLNLGPAISYTALSNTNTIGNIALNNVTITDADGVGSGSFLPRVYWKVGLGGAWSSSAATNVSSPYNFTIGTTGLVIGDTVYYYVIAQDGLGFVRSNPSSGLEATDVNTVTTPPTSPNSYRIVGLPLSGDYTVGTTAFNKLSGYNLVSKELTRQITVDVPITSPRNSDIEIVNRNNGIIQNSVLDLSKLEPSEHIIGYEFRTIDEKYYVLYQNDELYTGPNYIKSDGTKITNDLESMVGNYTTLTAALTDLNDRGVSGPVRFLLTDPIYPETNLLINITGPLPTSTNTVTIKPNTGVTTSIAADAATGQILKIFNTKYVIIDGSNTAGGTTRNLTIENTSGVDPKALWIGSNGTTPVTNITVKNCIIRNGANTNSAVYVSDGAVIGSPGYFNSITLTNNNVQKAYNAYYIIGNSAPGNGSGLVITGNDINSSGVNSIRQTGIYIQGVDGSTVSNNSLSNFTSSVESQFGIILYFTTNTTISGNNISAFSFTGAGGGAPYGIIIASDLSSSNINITGNIISNLHTSGSGTTVGIVLQENTSGVTIRRNKISNIKNTNPGGWGACGIFLGSSSETANTLVFNNLIFDVTGYGFSGSGVSDNGNGMYVAGGGGYNIYYNSVHLNSDQTDVTGLPSAITISSYVTNAGALNIRNNIFYNSQTIGTNRYAIYSDASNTVYSDINYNEYYTTGPNLGFLTSDITDLAAWKIATGKDASSVSAVVPFVSATDLSVDFTNISSWNINGKGTPVSFVSSDFVGNPRNTSIPDGSTDIGAYEFLPDMTPPPAAPSGSPSPGGTTTYSLAGFTLASITWGPGGSVPSNIDFYFYSGDTPPGGGSQSRSNCYWSITPAGGSGFTYDITFYYDEALLGPIAPETDLRLSKSEDGVVWESFLLLDDGSHLPDHYSVDLAANTITIYGLSNFSLFSLTDADAPLPVELNTFTASAKQREVTLDWETKSEHNTAKFVIMRSVTEENKWESVGEVNASGNTNSPVEYSFTDRKLNSGKYDYRLKIVDFDGAISYSAVINAEIELPKTYSLSQNYPNPFNPTTRIDYQLPQDARVILELYSITGEKVADLINVEQAAGYYTIDVSSSTIGRSLASGVYIYRMIAADKISGNNFVNVKKMMMLK